MFPDSSRNVASLHGVECVGEVERGDVGKDLIRRSIQYPLNCPDDRFHSSFTPHSKLIGSQIVLFEGVLEDGVGAKPIDQVSNGNGSNPSSWFGESDKTRGAEERWTGSLSCQHHTT